jgi:class 3 adenylate cyclase
MAGIRDERDFDERLGQLEKARSWSPRVVSKLENLLRGDDEDALFRINPLTFAKERNIAEPEAIDLFLHATAAGLMAMNWQLLCPKCSCVVESFRKLSGVTQQFHCRLCQADYEAAMDELIAVTFTVRPQIRDIALHHPETLSAWDYFFKSGGTLDGRLPDGTPFVHIQQSLGKAAEYVDSGATVEIDVDAPDGILFVANMQGKAALLCPLDGEAKPDRQLIELVLGDEEVTRHTLRNMAPGRFRVRVENQSRDRAVMIVALLPRGFVFGHAPITFVPFLTGKRLITTQAFRDLFRSELIKASEGLTIRDITLLFTDLTGSTALYDRVGDLNALSLVQQHFGRLQDFVVRHDGAVIKTIGDAVMAAFMKPQDAVAAALAMHAAMQDLNRDASERALVLKIGIHCGAAVAVTSNEQLDYFGQTANIASRVQNLAEAGEICLSQSVYDADGVRTTLGDELAPEFVALRGITENLRVYRVA